MEILQRELIYIWYYFRIQLQQIFWYWVLGMVIGSLVSVFAKDYIHRFFLSINQRKLGLRGIIIASVMGILSPLCMYGTIPIAASFARKGMRQDWLGAFMMSSVLLNPQLLMYSGALGRTAFLVRLFTCFLCGIGAGVMLRLFFQEKSFFRFEGFADPVSRDIAMNPFRRFINNLGRNLRATGIYFFIGILLAALFQRYVPVDLMGDIFGQNEGFGVLMAATIGVPLYACGGGTIPLLQAWLLDGMTLGSAAAFMITGPATKITNLGALKSVLGIRHFIGYLTYVMCFAFFSGIVVNLCIIH